MSIKRIFRGKMLIKSRLYISAVAEIRILICSEIVFFTITAVIIIDGMVIIKPISDFLIIQALLLFSFIRSPCSFAYDKPWAAFSLHVNLSDILSNNAQRE